MPRIAATQFKAKCLELMDRVAERRESYVITKHGRPVAKLVPADPRRSRGVLGILEGRFQSEGDLVASALTDREWDELAKGKAPRKAR
jgi:prevent-host-death family protein